MIIQKKAYAKINLYLKILDRISGTNSVRSGYHNIFTVMQKISLCDDIKINIKRGGKTNINIICADENIPADNTNTAYKAAELFFERFAGAGLPRPDIDVIIEITKKIPSQAGLGGGSSDAASVLLGLNEYFDYIFTGNILIEIAAKIGADVPFFAKDINCAVCEGIGEIVTPITVKSIKSVSVSDLYVLIVKPIYNISTKQAYEDFDEYTGKYSNNNFDKFDIADKNIISDIKTRGNITEIYNSFFALISLQNKNISEIHRRFTTDGAIAARLSGSGSALFAVFDGINAAQKCKDIINQRNDIEFCDIFKFLS